MEIKLKDGLKVGNEVIFNLTLRRITTADLMDAELASEKAVLTEVGMKMLVSPTTMGYELIRRSVSHVGDVARSLLLKELRALSERDFEVLQNGYYGLNKSTEGAGMSDEGRDDAARS